MAIIIDDQGVQQQPVETRPPSTTGPEQRIWTPEQPPVPLPTRQTAPAPEQRTWEPDIIKGDRLSQEIGIQAEFNRVIQENLQDHPEWADARLDAYNRSTNTFTFTPQEELQRQFRSEEQQAKLNLSASKPAEKRSLAGAEVFEELVEKGSIPVGSVFAGVDDKGNVKYYRRGTVVEVGKGEVMSAQDYKNLPPELKKVVKSEGVSGLQDLASKGNVPMADVLGDGWYHNGKIISTKARNVIIKEHESAQDKLTKQGKVFSEEWFKLGPNPADTMVRSKLLGEMTADALRNMATIQTNLQTKVASGAKKLPDIPKQIDPKQPRGLEDIARITASTGLAIGIGVLSSPIAVTHIVANPKQAPSIAKGMLSNIGQSFKTVGYDNFVSPVSPEKAGQAVGTVLLTAWGARNTAAKIMTYVAPKGVPIELAAKEWSTGRVPAQGFDTAELAAAQAQALKAVATKGGASSGSVPIGMSGYEIRWLKPAFQKATGDIVWHGTEDIGFIQGKTSFTAGTEGLYTSPYATPGFAAKGANPGFVMVLTDTAKVKSAPSSVLSNMTQSDAFIRAASEGLYGPSKVWRGSLETEIVASPGTTFTVPKPTADLLTRAVAGDWADFFTYNNGKFMPIKIAVDKGAVGVAPTAVDLYAIKLQTLQNSLQNLGEAIKHPVRSITDIVTRRAGPAGLREFQIVGPDGALRADTAANIASDLFYTASSQTAQEARRIGIAATSTAYQDLLDKNLNKAYEERANQLLKSYQVEVKAYDDKPAMREKFEEAYRANLSYNMSSAVSQSVVNSQVSRELEEADRTIAATSKSSTATREDIKAPTSTAVTKETESRTATTAPTSVTAPPTEDTPTTVTPPRGDTRTPPPIEKPPFPPPVEVDEEKTKGSDKKIYPPGTVAWKQGIGWWVITPPYKNKENRMFVLKKPAGATIASSIKKAVDTIQTYGGTAPASLKFDMGIVDVKIEKPPVSPSRDAGRKAITFKRDKDGTYGGRTTKATRYGPYYQKNGALSRRPL